MYLAAKMDELGRPAWLTAMILGWILWWPVGLALLIFTLSSGRLRHWRHSGPGQWYNTQGSGEQMNQQQGWAGPWGGCGRRRSRYTPPPSGNMAFDEYRAETLRRLEEEQKEFVDYLDRLRKAKDKSEFDQFMAERRRNGGAPPAPAADVV